MRLSRLTTRVYRYIQEELDDFERFIRYVSDWLVEHDASI